MQLQMQYRTTTVKSSACVAIQKGFACFIGQIMCLYFGCMKLESYKFKGESRPRSIVIGGQDWPCHLKFYGILISSTSINLRSFHCNVVPF